MENVLRKRIGRRAALRAGAVGATLGLSSAANLPATLAQDATPAANTTPPGVTPERVVAAVARLDSLAQQTLDETGIPGLAIAVVYDDAAVYEKGFGVRAVGEEGAVDADTVFQLASLSKPISSTVVAGLVGDGAVTWDSRLCDLLPAFQMHQPWVTNQVTIRDMFSHRSGLADHAGDHLEDLGFTRDEILHRLRFLLPGSSLRSTWAYTNFGLTAGAVAAAAAVGQDWETLGAERLFQPLGMTHSSYRFADFITQPNHATGHVKIDGVWSTHHMQREPDAQSPAGGVSSNVRDLTAWMRLQLGQGTFEGEEIIAAAGLNETHLPEMVSNFPANASLQRAGFYGLGWNVNYDDLGGVRVSHSGAFNLGAGTTVLLYPAAKLGIIVLSNAQPIGAVETLTAEFSDLATFGEIRHDYRTIFAKAFIPIMAPTYGTEVDYLTPPANPQPALAAEAYVGTYENDYYGTLGISAEGDSYTLHLGPDQTPYPLTHFDRDTFHFQPQGENAYGPSGATFTIGATGPAASVTVEYLNQAEQGTFLRSAAAEETV